MVDKKGNTISISCAAAFITSSGGGAGGTRQLKTRDAAARASRSSPQRGGSQFASRKPGGSQRVQTTPKRGTTRIGVNRGTQRVGQRRGTQRVGLGGGTTRIGGRAGGTTRIGGQAKTQGPRGLFGGRAGRRDTNLVRRRACPGRRTADPEMACGAVQTLDTSLKHKGSCTGVCGRRDGPSGCPHRAPAAVTGPQVRTCASLPAVNAS